MGPENIAPDAEEREKHISAIASISELHHLPTETVAPLYERELAHIKQDALITIYLPIFVTRRLNEMLSSRAALDSPTSAERTLGIPH